MSERAEDALLPLVNELIKREKGGNSPREGRGGRKGGGGKWNSNFFVCVRAWVLTCVWRSTVGISLQ